MSRAVLHTGDMERAVNHAREIISAADPEDIVTSYSGGKDSAVLLDIVQSVHPRSKVVHFWIYPDCVFSNRVCEAARKRYGAEVDQLPHPIYHDMLRQQQWTTPKRAAVLAMCDLRKKTFRSLSDAHYGARHWSAIGMRMTDSFRRRMVLRSSHGINLGKKELYPIYDWTESMVKLYLREREIDLPAEHSWFGTSFDGVSYQFLVPIKTRMPDEYEKIKRHFPLIDVELARYDSFK